MFSNAIILQMIKEGRFQNRLFEIVNDLVLHPYKDRSGVDAFANMSGGKLYKSLINQEMKTLTTYTNSLNLRCTCH